MVNNKRQADLEAAEVTKVKVTTLEAKVSGLESELKVFGGNDKADFIIRLEEKVKGLIKERNNLQIKLL